MSETRSEALYREACEVIPGGVNSPVRAFRAVGGTPIFIASAEGAHVTDADGNRYIDFVSSWGAIALGHANPIVNDAIAKAAAAGTSYGAPHEGEFRLAREVVNRVPGLDWIRFVNSGTEAALAVIRLARAITGRTRILKFEGNYHGAVDPLLVKAGSGVATLNLPDSAGVPLEAAGGTLVARFNDLAHVRELLDSQGSEVAAVMIEPVAGNMGLVPPDPGFLEGVRDAAHAAGALLVMDEVMTGFRVSRGGASELYGVHGDLTIMGKVIGGGLPVGAYGGRRDLMEWVSPLGPMYQAGTLSGNPLAMAAGRAALSVLDEAAYGQLETRGAQLEEGLRRAASNAGVPAQVQRVGSMISVFFADQPVHNFAEAQASNKALFAKIFHELLARGVYLPPSALESWFLNLAHSASDIDHAVAAFSESLHEVKK